MSPSTLPVSAREDRNPPRLRDGNPFCITIRSNSFQFNSRTTERIPCMSRISAMTRAVRGPRCASGTLKATDGAPPRLLFSTRTPGVSGPGGTSRRDSPSTLDTRSTNSPRYEFPSASSQPNVRRFSARSARSGWFWLRRSTIRRAPRGILLKLANPVIEVPFKKTATDSGSMSARASVRRRSNTGAAYGATPIVTPDEKAGPEPTRSSRDGLAAAGTAKHYARTAMAVAFRITRSLATSRTLRRTRR